eukprot:1730815-Rhodomonas_salina.2
MSVPDSASHARRLPPLSVRLPSDGHTTTFSTWVGSPAAPRLPLAHPLPDTRSQYRTSHTRRIHRQIVRPKAVPTEARYQMYWGTLSNRLQPVLWSFKTRQRRIARMTGGSGNQKERPESLARLRIAGFEIWVSGTGDFGIWGFGFRDLGFGFC